MFLSLRHYTGVVVEGNGGVVIDVRAGRCCLEGLVLRSRGLTWDAPQSSMVALSANTQLVRIEQCEMRGFNGRVVPASGFITRQLVVPISIYRAFFLVY